MERLRQHLDEFAEVHALVGDVVKNRLVAVALVLHVADLHLQFKLLGNLSRANHRVVFAGLSLLVLFQIRLSRLAVNASHLHALFQVRFLHLQQYQSACERHHADVVSRHSFYRYHIALV